MPDKPDRIPDIEPALDPLVAGEPQSFDDAVDFDRPNLETSPPPGPDEPVLVEARISWRAPNPMQSAPAHEDEWVVEFEPLARPGIDPLMGWVSSCDVLQQVHMTFPSREAAEAYCRRQGVPFTVTPRPRSRRAPKRRSYTDNFLPFPDGRPKPIYPH